MTRKVTTKGPAPFSHIELFQILRYSKLMPSALVYDAYRKRRFPFPGRSVAHEIAAIYLVYRAIRASTKEVAMSFARYSRPPKVVMDNRFWVRLGPFPNLNHCAAVIFWYVWLHCMHFRKPNREWLHPL